MTKPKVPWMAAFSGIMTGTKAARLLRIYADDVEKGIPVGELRVRLEMEEVARRSKPRKKRK